MKYLLFCLLMLVGCASTDPMEEDVYEDDGIEVVPNLPKHYAIRLSGMDFSPQSVSALLAYLDKENAEVVAFLSIPGQPGIYLVIVKK